MPDWIWGGQKTGDITDRDRINPGGAWGWKGTVAALFADQWLALYPDSPVIEMRRDVDAAAHSLWRRKSRKLNYPNDLAPFKANVVRVMKCLASARREPWKVVRYETFLGDARTAFAWLGLPSKVRGGTVFQHR